MSITQHGLICDVCGAYILPGLDPAFERFGVKGIDRELQCHLACRSVLEQMAAAKDWRVLPPGPLRDAYERQEEKR